MTHIDKAADKTAAQIAEDTLNLLHGRIDPELEDRLLASGDPAPLLQSLRMMASLEPLANDPAVRAVLGRYRTQAESPRRKQNRRWLGFAAAAALIVAVAASLTVMVYQPAVETTAARYVTRIGEQKTISLEDGSQLTLNTGTSLLVEMSPAWRRITLDRGEVYFNVKADAQRPFTVNLGERAVSVLGTAFNLYKSPDKFTLAVVEGVVAIHGREDTASVDSPALMVGDNQRARLTSAGQRKVLAGTVAEYDYSNQQLVAYRDNHIEKRQAWRTGMLVFEDVPLGDVIQELNRYSSRKILLESSALMDKRVYAAIDVRQLSVALEGLQDSVPIKIVTHFDRIVITEKP